MEYDVPEKLALLIDKAEAFTELRDKCIKSPFGFRRAKNCAVKRSYFLRKFWGGVYDLYPELLGKNMEYLSNKQKIIIVQEGEK